jgi:thiosulfate/3-mercaptopyruvate sulfurtransferase
VRSNVLVTADELADRLTAAPVVLLDVRWALGRTDGRAQYLAGHLPGAVFVDLERELSAPPSPERGRHPLPAPGDLERAVRRWGVSDGSFVVAYDDTGGMAAARAWWLLRYFGHPDVSVLDGGLEAWVAAGRPLEVGMPIAPQTGTFVPRAGGMPVLDAAAAARVARDGVLLDARAAERYRGESEPIDPVAGHIPGARNHPATDNIDADGRFRPADDLRSTFTEHGVGDGVPVGAYCGSGVTAAHQVLALELAGFTAALYPGSWSEWIVDPDRPVARG